MFYQRQSQLFTTKAERSTCLAVFILVCGKESVAQQFSIFQKVWYWTVFLNKALVLSLKMTQWKICLYYINLMRHKVHLFFAFALVVTDFVMENLDFKI